MLNPHLDILPEALQPLLQQNWEKLSAALDQVKSTPTSFIDDLTRVLTGSNFVTEQLERNPEMLSDLLDSGNLYTEYAPNFYQESLQSILAPLETEEQLHKAVR